MHHQIPLLPPELEAAGAVPKLKVLFCGFPNTEASSPLTVVVAGVTVVVVEPEAKPELPPNTGTFVAAEA